MVSNHGVFGLERETSGLTRAQVAAMIADALGAGAGVPVGAIVPYGAAVAPAGYLVCDGSAVSRDDYAALFEVIGITFGAGDGSTTFNVPDLRGRAPIGAGTGTGLTARTLGDAVGAETVALTEANLAAHTHSLTSGSASTVGHSHSFSGSSGSDSHSHSLSGTAASDGSHQHTYQGATFTNGAAGGSAAAAATGEPTEFTNSSGSHTHSVSGTALSTSHSHTVSGTVFSENHSHTLSGSSGSAGSGTGHANVQPSRVVQFIIRALG